MKKRKLFGKPFYLLKGATKTNKRIIKTFSRETTLRKQARLLKSKGGRVDGIYREQAYLTRKGGKASLRSTVTRIPARTKSGRY